MRPLVLLRGVASFSAILIYGDAARFYFHHFTGLTGAEDRLHDDRARNVIEAIMWHGYSKKSDAYAATEKFYYLSPADREAVVAFIDAI